MSRKSVYLDVKIYLVLLVIIQGVCGLECDEEKVTGVKFYPES